MPHVTLYALEEELAGRGRFSGWPRAQQHGVLTGEPASMNSVHGYEAEKLRVARPTVWRLTVA
jgi:hypothetical protein